MTRMALLLLLLVPSVANAQQADEVPALPQPVVQPTPAETTSPAPLAPDEPEAGGMAAERTLAPRYRPAAASPGGWFGDVGFYVLRPQWSGGNPAFTTTTTTTLVEPGSPTIEEQLTIAEQTDFDHDASFAPLVSIGYAGRNGLGLRVRWWTLEADDSVAGSGPNGVLMQSLRETVTAGYLVPSLLGTTSGFQAVANHVANQGDILEVEGRFRNQLDLDVIDAEGLWNTTIGRSSLLASAGVRYAQLGQSFDGDLGLATDAAEATATLRSHQTFKGAGPTVALQAHRLIGQTNLSVYGLSRGSLLFGESRQRATTSFQDSFRVDTDLVLRTIASSKSLNSDSLRPVLEFEVGANWTRSLAAFDLFAESGLVGMAWFNAGNAANSEALVGSGLGTVDSDSTHSNLGLIGLRFTTGVRF